ncbi:ectoine/hydroxyectoine ABC transporter substrate-binding protein EhuB [Shouchella clausii]|uniref:ectoine/hydroxyectoine ABC transporter substrate-binding protein EhuB n=1 Tax=Shouchella clausii TaxID=79880 RepID=UPI000BA6429B|nr:ectoine/hydroxyectoine ABC transporter substrate-binding protein EhuB [Shouchella clausii]PAD14790.1 ectoine/hydroxyectoine ABC transporter substrate-binding protein EhuB [Shouchella clausii]
MKKAGIFGLLTSAVVLAACGGGNTIQVGVANEEPYGYIDTDAGEVTGASPEIARAVLQKMGYEDIEGTVVDFGALIQGVNSGQFDIVTAGMDIQPERCANGNFGNIEMQYGEGIVVASGNPLNITSYEDIAEDPDIRVALMAGANQEAMLLALGADESQFVSGNSIADNIAAVENGQADVMVATDATANSAAQNNTSGKVEFVEDFTQPVIDGEEQIAYGAAVFPQSEAGEEMREEYNAALQELIDSGELLEIIEPFGFTEANLPPEDITMEDRCNA